MQRPLVPDPGPTCVGLTPRSRRTDPGDPVSLRCHWPFPMRLLVVSDLHGDLASVREAIDHFAPDVLLSCGDWGDSDQVTEADLAAFPARLPTLTTFGN